MGQIPIFIHHEIGQKIQSGKDNKQVYLKVCLDSAITSGNRVILFGDQGNVDWCPESVDVATIHSDLWNLFEQDFENFSTYNDAWAKGIYHRFFYFYEYAVANEIEEFFVLDSDILIYRNMSELLDEFAKYDLAACMPMRQSLLGDDGMRWTINVGISYWKRDTLKRFLDFCIDTYANHKDTLLPKWEFHKAHGLPGGVCEMSLVYRFVHDCDISMLNLLDSGKDDIYFNSNMNGREDYTDNEYKVFPILNLKRFVFRDGIPYLCRMDGGERKVYGLHFLGDSKLFMYDVFYKKRITFPTYFACSMFCLRAKLGAVKRKIMK